ncbi:hypothetical protein [Streptococcus halichoeri]|uniref:hypothetical protein n=1 Tax=Streptococcus halichoeri TaxID=254785 RepID=UPI001359A47F|nr:hypothetical protein [Streptococcus halichoeri]
MIRLENITLEKFCTRINQADLKISFEKIPKNPTLFDDNSYFRLNPKIIREQIDMSFILSEMHSYERFMFWDSFKNNFVSYYDEVNNIAYLEIEFDI